MRVTIFTCVEEISYFSLGRMGAASRFGIFLVLINEVQFKLGRLLRDCKEVLYSWNTVGSVKDDARANSSFRRGSHFCYLWIRVFDSARSSDSI